MTVLMALNRKDKVQDGSIIRCATIPRTGWAELFVTVGCREGQDGLLCLKQATDLIRARAGTPVAADLFTDRGQQPGLGFPYCHLISKLHGTTLWAITDKQVSYTKQAGRTVASLWEDQYGVYLRLAGLIPADLNAPAEVQAWSIFDQMDQHLNKLGMAFTDVVRTWFYNQRITSWYDGFNRVRNEFFNNKDVFDGVVPASTGIGMPNAEGAALTAGLFAVRPRSSLVKISAVPSPLQGPAWEYGSSFSRAVELAWPDHSRLMISGTASIDRNGQTCHRDDPQAQIRLTFEVLEQLLASRGYNWTSVTRAIAYLTDLSFLPLLHHELAIRQGCQALPILAVHAQVCRDDLLFEMELDAIKT